MRHYALLAVLLLAATSARSQPCDSLAVTATDPEERAASVPLNQSVAFSFNCTVDPQMIGFLAQAFGSYSQGGEPQLNAGSLSADSLSVSFAATHLADEDYLWLLLGRYANHGISIPFETRFLRYTTAESFGPYSVSGRVLESSASAGKMPQGFVQMASEHAEVVLRRHSRGKSVQIQKSDFPLLQTIVYLFEGTDFMSSTGIVAGTHPDPVTGAYIVDDLRAGQYVPLVVRWDTLDAPILGYLDADGNRQPDYIEITTASLREVDLQLIHPEELRISAQEAETLLRETAEQADLGPIDELYEISAWESRFDGKSSGWDASFAGPGGTRVDTGMSSLFIWTSSYGNLPPNARPIPVGWVDSSRIPEAVHEHPDTADFYAKYADSTGSVSLRLGDLQFWGPSSPDESRTYWRFDWSIYGQAGRPSLEGFVDAETGELAAHTLFEPLEPGMARDYLPYAIELVAEAAGVTKDDLRLYMIGSYMSPRDSLWESGRASSWFFQFVDASGAHWSASTSAYGHSASQISTSALDEPVDLPENWLDSGDIVAAALEAGGRAFLEQYPESSVRLFGGYLGSHGDFFVGHAPGLEGKAAWAVQFAPSEGGSLTIRLDMETGELIDAREYEPPPAGPSAPFVDMVESLLLGSVSQADSLDLVYAGTTGTPEYEPALAAGMSGNWSLILKDELHVYRIEISQWQAHVTVFDSSTYDSGSVPTNYVDSDEAFAAALVHGGAELLEAYPDMRIQLHGGFSSHISSRFPGFADRAVWLFEFDPWSDHGLTVVVDMASGEVLMPLAPGTAQDYLIHAFALVKQMAPSAADSLRVYSIRAVMAGDEIESGRSDSWEYTFIGKYNGRWLASLTPIAHTAHSFSGVFASAPVRLPDTWLDSDQVVARALDEGGRDYMALHPESSVTLLGGHLADGDDFFISGPSGIEGRAAWAVQFAPPEGGTLTIRLDMETGELIDSRAYEPLPAGPSVTFLELALALFEDLYPVSDSLQLTRLLAHGFVWDEPDLALGMSHNWSFDLHDGTVSYFVELTPERVHLRLSGRADAPSVFTPFPYVDSDEAFASALEVGGADFLEEHPAAFIQILGGFDPWSGDLDRRWPDRALWLFKFDPGSDHEFSVAVDMSTGEVLEPAPLRTFDEADEVARASIDRDLVYSGELQLFYAETFAIELADGTAAEWSLSYLNEARGRIDVGAAGTGGEFVRASLRYSHPDWAPLIPEIRIGSAEACSIALTDLGIQAFLARYDPESIHLSAGVTRFPDLANRERPTWDLELRAPADGTNRGPSQAVVIDMETAEIYHSIYVGIDDQETPPPACAPLQLYPNPLNSRATIEYCAIVPGRVRLEVFDVLGRRVVTLLDDHVREGRASLRWNPGDLAPGLYLVRMRGPDIVKTQPVLKIR